MKIEKRTKYIKLIRQRKQKEITGEQKNSGSYITTKQLENALIAYKEHLKREKNITKINVLKK